MLCSDWLCENRLPLWCAWASPPTVTLDAVLNNLVYVCVCVHMAFMLCCLCICHYLCCDCVLHMCSLCVIQASIWICVCIYLTVWIFNVEQQHCSVSAEGIIFTACAQISRAVRVTLIYPWQYDLHILFFLEIYSLSRFGKLYVTLTDKRLIRSFCLVFTMFFSKRYLKNQ